MKIYYSVVMQTFLDLYKAVMKTTFLFSLNDTNGHVLILNHVSLIQYEIVL